MRPRNVREGCKPLETSNTKGRDTMHTKSPWKADDEIVDIGFDDESANDESHICVCYGPDAMDNAAFIVRACNSHDELVAALEALAGRFREVAPDDTGLDPHDKELLEIAEAAIAKAKKSS